MHVLRFREEQTVSKCETVDDDNRDTQKTHLVQLVAQINRVNVVAFEVREHDDLAVEVSAGKGISEHDTYEENHREQQPCCEQDREEEQPA